MKIVYVSRNATAQLEKQGVCEDMDASVTMLTVFGREYQYKDTPACRELVSSSSIQNWIVFQADAHVFFSALFFFDKRYVTIVYIDRCAFVYCFVSSRIYLEMVMIIVII